jgi:UDP-N-acetylmuramate dehydrogenase
MSVMAPSQRADTLREQFAGRLQEQVALARYTAARVGGPADFLLEARSARELAEMAQKLWAGGTRFTILGGGSNVLVSDQGVRGVVILNRAREVQFQTAPAPPRVWAESGANFGALARQAASRGLAGLAWAGGIPGTLGGAIVGNAGAHGSDMSDNLLVAEILHHLRGRETWPVERLSYAYRDSALKGRGAELLVLSAVLRLEPGSVEAIRAEMDTYLEHRRRTQPPGASMGSMFKNPPGDYAGRLIEAAGLKGERQDGAQISSLHANFFINHGGARAADVLRLIRKARQAVLEQFQIELELEVELMGDWTGYGEL